MMAVTIMKKKKKKYIYIFHNRNNETASELVHAQKTVKILIVSITKFSIVIGSPRAYLSRNRRAIAWVSNYRCPI